MLGRGNLQAPSKGIDGMIRLVRRLLPQDLVAVQAWNRATPFTTNHAQIVAMLERYRSDHLHIESLLAQHFSGLAAIYGGRDLPEWVHREIDAVLSGPEGLHTRTAVPAPVSSDATDARFRRGLDALQPASSLDPFQALEAARIGMSLDEVSTFSPPIVRG